MQQFKAISKPIEVDFFSIYTRSGIRYIHLWGYIYESDCYWANMEACGVELPLEEFISESQKRESVLDYTDELYEQCKQYQDNYTEVAIVDVINHYYRDIVFSVDYLAKNDGRPDAYLDYSEVTMDTPDGDYITTPR